MSSASATWPPRATHRRLGASDPNHVRPSYSERWFVVRTQKDDMRDSSLDYTRTDVTILRFPDAEYVNICLRYNDVTIILA